MTQRLVKKLKRVAMTNGLSSVDKVKLGYSIKRVMQDEIDHYMTYGYCEETGRMPSDIHEYELKFWTDIAIKEDLAEDVYRDLIEYGYIAAGSQFDQEDKDYINGKIDKLDSIANTDDLVPFFQGVLKTVEELYDEQAN